MNRRVSGISFEEAKSAMKQAMIEKFRAREPCFCGGVSTHFSWFLNRDPHGSTSSTTLLATELPFLLPLALNPKLFHGRESDTFLCRKSNAKNQTQVTEPLEH
jgi:hypothetical protein